MECKNCKSTLRDEDGFCSGCGARIIDERISFKFLLKEFLDKVLSIDNKLLKTFWHLFTKPHIVIDGYINGVRKKYFNPFSYLLLSITLSGISIYFLKDAAIESMQNFNVNPNANNAFNNEEFTKKIMGYIYDYQAFLSALVIPFYGFISWLVFFNKKKYNFIEHMVIYFFASAQFSIVNFLIVTPIYFINSKISNTVSLIFLGLSLAYNAYILINLFKLNFFQFIIKTLYFLFIGIFLYILISILVVVISFMVLGKEYFEQFIPKGKDSIQKYCH